MFMITRRAVCSDLVDAKTRWLRFDLLALALLSSDFCNPDVKVW